MNDLLIVAINGVDALTADRLSVETVLSGGRSLGAVPGEGEPYVLFSTLVEGPSLFLSIPRNRAAKFAEMAYPGILLSASGQIPMEPALAVS